jgi:hypothetical protein
METRGRGVLDTPLESVIGLAEGESRWRGMTAERSVPAILVKREMGARRKRAFSPYETSITF